jgi:Fe-S-cluster containining protein
VKRIESLTSPESTPTTLSPLAVELQSLIGSASGFRPLKAGDRRFHGFTHTLEKRSDGRCRFLTEENRCSLHDQHGATAKPAMCQLFPHSFSVTPGGVFAYVSFASSAVLSNSGQLLVDQEEMLQRRYEQYSSLFRESYADWSKLQLIDGLPLPWEQFERIEAKMLAVFDEQSSNDSPSAIDKLLICSRIVVEHLPDEVDPEQLPPLEAPPHIVDRIILKHLTDTYLPEQVFEEREFDLDARALMTDIVQAPPVVSTSDQRLAYPKDLGALPDDVEDLFNRFAYARLFAKLYLGPNLAHLSLVAGLHHLILVLCLLRQRLKETAAAGGQVDFTTAAEVLRTLERRLCQMNYSSQSSAVMEVLLSSPVRVKRVAQLVR